MRMPVQNTKRNDIRAFVRGRFLPAASAVAFLGLGACGAEKLPPEAELVSGQSYDVGAAVAAPDSDVDAVKFELFDCPGPGTPDHDKDGVPDGQGAVFTRVSQLGPGYLPDGLQRFQNNPLDEKSAHAYADALFVVEAERCYVARTTPLKSAEPLLASADCYQATKQIGGVKDGLTLKRFWLTSVVGRRRGPWMWSPP